MTKRKAKPLKPVRAWAHLGGTGYGPLVAYDLYHSRREAVKWSRPDHTVDGRAGRVEPVRIVPEAAYKQAVDALRLASIRVWSNRETRQIVDALDALGEPVEPKRRTP